MSAVRTTTIQRNVPKIARTTTISMRL